MQCILFHTSIHNKRLHLRAHIHTHNIETYFMIKMISHKIEFLPFMLWINYYMAGMAYSSANENCINECSLKCENKMPFFDVSGDMYKINKKNLCLFKKLIQRCCNMLYMRWWLFLMRCCGHKTVYKWVIEILLMSRFFSWRRRWSSHNDVTWKTIFCTKHF